MLKSIRFGKGWLHGKCHVHGLGRQPSSVRPVLPMSWRQWPFLGTHTHTRAHWLYVLYFWCFAKLFGRAELAWPQNCTSQGPPHPWVHHNRALSIASDSYLQARYRKEFRQRWSLWSKFTNTFQRELLALEAPRNCAILRGAIELQTQPWSFAYFGASHPHTFHSLDVRMWVNPLAEALLNKSTWNVLVHCNRAFPGFGCHVLCPAAILFLFCSLCVLYWNCPCFPLRHPVVPILQWCSCGFRPWACLLPFVMFLIYWGIALLRESGRNGRIENRNTAKKATKEIRRKEKTRDGGRELKTQNLGSKMSGSGIRSDPRSSDSSMISWVWWQAAAICKQWVVQM